MGCRMGRLPVVRCLTALLLALCFMALGTGSLEYLHALDHDREDVALAKSLDAPPGHLPAHPVHDDTNCLLHAQLHMPMISIGWAPFLICVGLFIAMALLAAPRLSPQRAAVPANTRGPPSFG
jgi:hypothetical protein